MKYVLGIGNPGREYAGTRHNVGFDVIDAIGPITGAARIKPDTFVNLTGDAVRKIVQKSSARPGDFLLVCDDVNLDFGKLRLRAAGSAGGHHGLRSVIEALETEDFARLRVGVRTARMPKALSGYVLGRFTKEEKKRLGKIVERAARICRTWVEKGFEAAQRELSRLQSAQK